MANDNWYYAKDGHQQGPVAVETLQMMARNGELRAQDLVWTDGMTNWSAAGSVAEIFPSPPAAGGYPAPAASDPGYPVGAAQPAGPAGPIPMNYYVPPRTLQYAGFWLRFCAAFIDGILTSIVGVIIALVVQLAIGGIRTGPQNPGSVDLLGTAINQVLSICLGWLYSALMESSRHQATLGKMAIGIKVTDMAGQRISFGRATGRHFAKIISGIILLIGYIMAAFTERKQALHDIMAGTLVVRK